MDLPPFHTFFEDSGLSVDLLHEGIVQDGIGVKTFLRMITSESLWNRHTKILKKLAQRRIMRFKDRKTFVDLGLYGGKVEPRFNLFLAWRAE